MNVSTGVSAQLRSLTGGGDGRRKGWNAQWAAERIAAVGSSGRGHPCRPSPTRGLPG